MINVTSDSVYDMLFEKRRGRPSQHVVVSNIKGRIPDGMKPADPEEIFRNLKVKKTFSGPVLESIQSLLNLSRQTNSAMNQAYGESKMIEDKRGRKGLLVTAKGIDRPNATRFLKLLIENAFDARVLKIAESMRVENTSRGALIYAWRKNQPKWVV